MSEAHGYSTYSNQGCRCAVCVAANTEYGRGARRRREGSLQPGDTRHGLASSYVNYRCRCAECRAAWAAYARALNKRKKGATR